MNGCGDHGLFRLSNYFCLYFTTPFPSPPLPKVYLEGRLSQRKYTDREGIQRTSVEVIANEMQMLSPKPVLSGVGAEENHDPFLPDLPEDAS